MMKKTIVSLMALVILTMCSSTFAALDAPTGLTVNPGLFGIFFDWDYEEAETIKYSVDVEGWVSYIYFDDGPQFGIARVEVSMGTSDYNFDMTRSHLWISKYNFASLLAEEIGEDEVFILGFLGEAKVKALNPSTKGRQNNPFSELTPFGVFINRLVIAD